MTASEIKNDQEILDRYIWLKTGVKYIPKSLRPHSVMCGTQYNAPCDCGSDYEKRMSLKNVSELSKEMRILERAFPYLKSIEV